MERYRAKLHHLTPNAFIALSKFYWVQHTFGGHIDVDSFARLFELHIQRKRVTFDEEEGILEAHFVCCTFATQRKNKKQKIMRFELSHGQKNRWDDNWLRYWFYVKVDMADVSRIRRSFYPFSGPFFPMDISTTPPFTRSKVVKECENAFYSASKSISGRDLVEEFLATNI